MLACVYMCSLLGGRGAYNRGNIPVQEHEGQRGEGAYFREDTVLLILVAVNITVVKATKIQFQFQFFLEVSF